MKEYKRILIAVDGSDQSLKAFKEVLSIAHGSQNAAIYIVAVINDVELSTSAYSYGKVFAQEKELTENRVLKLVQDAREVNIHQTVPYVIVGNPKSVIVNYAEEKAIDLIVLGATGKGAIQRALVGSTAAYVVNHAPCSVLVVK